MEHTLTPSIEWINRRYARTAHELLLVDDTLTCRVDHRARNALNARALRIAVEALVKAGCVESPSRIDESAGATTFHWHRPGKLTYAWEWPVAGWRAAAITTLRALETLRPLNLTLRALQHGDLFMRGTHPMLANLGAIMPWSNEATGRTLEQLDRHFVRPLRCAARGRATLARQVLRPNATGFTAEQAEAIAGDSSPESASRTISDALDFVENLDFPTQSGSRASWDTYEARMTVGQSAEISAKSAIVLSTLTRTKPASVLDLGCNTGLFSQLAANEGATSVIGVDSDEDVLNTFFTRAANWQGLAVPVVMDLADPSPARGWGEGWCSPAEHRLSSELVLALALIHHVALGARLRAEEIRRCFASLASRWLLLEFVPLGPTNPYAWGAEFYTLEWMLRTLADDFELRRQWPHGERDRVLLLFEKRHAPSLP